MSRKKKAGIIIAVIIIIAATGAGAWYFLNGNIGIGNSADKVYVEKVSNLNSANSGVQNRYSGVVEPQESWKVDKDMEREVKEIFVEEGDMVEEGDSLFEYDMEDVKADLAQAELDLESMQNEITDARNQISQLTKERDAAPAEEKFQYTAKIQETENGIKQTEYNIESKKAEMAKKQENIDNAVITSKIAGVVKSINKSGNDEGGDSSYMTILAVGDFRIKGTVSETNVQMLSEDQPVILRSRVNEEQTWAGTITKIDTQNEVSNNNDMYMYDSFGGGEKATKYPFYVTLDDTDGLMMGQHLFIELGEEQTEEKEGIWLFEGYIVREHADGTPVESGMNMDLENDMDLDGAGDMDFEEDMDLGDAGDMDFEEDMNLDDAGDMDFEEDMDLEGSEDGSSADGEYMSLSTSKRERSGFTTMSTAGSAEVAIADFPDSEDGTDADEDKDKENPFGLGAAGSDTSDGTDILGGTDMIDEIATSDEMATPDETGMDEDIITYVWAANDKNRLEKRRVELGEYDAATGEYEILSGLTEDDYIAFPMEGLYEGVATVTNMEDVDYTSPLYNQGEEGETPEGGEGLDEGDAGGGEMLNGGELIDDMSNDSPNEDSFDEDSFDEDSFDEYSGDNGSFEDSSDGTESL